MRYKRSERIVFMTQYLMNHPNQLIPLTFCENLNKRSHRLVKTFKSSKYVPKEKLGTVITTAGASGGVTYKPMMSKEEAIEIIEEIITMLQEKERLLPGGYLFYRT